MSKTELRLAADRIQGQVPSPAQKKAIAHLVEKGRMLERMLNKARQRLIYVDPAVFALRSRLKNVAIEVDFGFGDRDGQVSLEDLDKARTHYGKVRGPVGWNRWLLTDELERCLFPSRTLPTSGGQRLVPEDWLMGPPDPLYRLKKVASYLDDAALARTYADIAARVATVVHENPSRKLQPVFEGALVLLGREIRKRDGIRPTITDIARIGCEDPDVKACLRTPIEMSRRLTASNLLDRYLRQTPPLASDPLRS